MLLDTVEVVSIEDDGFYSDAYTSGSCVKVTLCKGNVYASCEQILIWEEELAEDCFEEWVMLADAGEEGYATWME
jgi:hypothetical protein